MKTRNAHCGLMLGLRSLAAGVMPAAGRRCWHSLCVALCWMPLATLHAVVPTYQQLKWFEEPVSGAILYSGLVQGIDGALYGTASQGGSYGYGTVFKLNADSSGFSVLKNFDSSPAGRAPYGDLIQDAGGVLYGTAYYGGIHGYGTVFKLNPDGTGFSVLKHLDNASTGGYLTSGLIQGTGGALYGTAYQGGSIGYGTVFKLNTDGSGFTVLKNFDNYTTGGYLYGGLMQGADGTLYGTTQYGGSSGYGTLFKLNPDGTGFTVLKNFDGSTTGGSPRGKLIQGTSGMLYGTAYQGGGIGYGTLFKLSPDGTGFAILKNFDYSTSGANPIGGLMQGTDGTLYGTAVSGGSSGSGTAFQLNPDGSDFSVLLNFNSSTTGRYPYGGLLQGADGSLYGTTANGGTADASIANAGTVFRLIFDNPPVVNAGSDFSVNEGQLSVALDGSLSSDPDNDTLTYAWAQVSGTAVTLSDAAAQKPTFTAPVVALGGETLSFELTVTANGVPSIDTVSVTVVNVNHPPVADAGLDQSVAEGSPVTLHGEDSFDIDTDLFTYAWVQVGGVPTVTLSDPAAQQPTFTAPTVGTGGAPGVVATLVFELTVDDGYPPDAAAPGYTLGDVVDSVTVEITNTNNDPTADAGADQTVDEQSAVALNGTTSSDPDTDTLTSTWTQVGGPSVALTGATTATPSFTAPFVSAGGADLEFELTVDDGYEGIDTDTVVIHVQNINDPPLASAAQPTTAVLWPPNHGLVAVGITGVSDPDNNATITITGVTQDEPTSGLGDGDTAIDAIINGDGTVLLRAERSGKGDGRVYRIAFTASDPEGSVSGVVFVKVPNTLKKPAIDSGWVFDSTQ